MSGSSFEDEVAKRVIRALKEKELLKIGNRSYVNAFKYPESRFDAKDLMTDGGTPEDPPIGQVLTDPGKLFTDKYIIPPSALEFILAGKYYTKWGTPEKAGMIEGGLTDAATSIQSMLNALPGGGQVFAKAATYLINRKVTFPYGNVKLEGEGPSSIFKCNAALGDYYFEVYGKAGVSMMHLLFDGSGLNCYGVHFVGGDCIRGIFAFNEMKDFNAAVWYGGVDFSSSGRGSILSNHFYNCRWPITLSGSGVYCFGHVVDDNEIYLPTQHGIHIDEPYRCIVSHNVIVISGMNDWNLGIVIDGSYNNLGNTIEANVIEGGKESIRMLAGSVSGYNYNTIVKGNKLLNASQYSVDEQGNANGSSFEGNTVNMPMNFVTLRSLLYVKHNPGYTIEANPYYLTPIWGLDGNSRAGVANRVFLTPFLIGQRLTINEFCWNVKTGSAAKHMWPTLYADAGGTPATGARLWSGAEEDVDPPSNPHRQAIAAPIACYTRVVWAALATEDAVMAFSGGLGTQFIAAAANYPVMEGCYFTMGGWAAPPDPCPAVTAAASTKPDVLLGVLSMDE